MNNEVKLSIIIPVYNVESYLKKCLDSIIKNYNKNIEVILVDDGSKDNSGEICDLYAHEYDFIKVNHRSNGGLSVARNTGVNLAIGKYIWFVDSDDYISDTSIVDIFTEIENDVDVIVGNYSTFCENKIKDVYQDFIDIKDNELLFEYFNRLGNVSYAAVRFIVKREVIIKNNLKFIEGIYHEDEEWTPRVLCSAKSFSIIKDVIYNYRVGNSNSIMGMKNPKKISDKIFISKLIYQNMQKISVDKSKREFLKSRIAHNYIVALNEVNLYSGEDKKKLLIELKDNIYLLNSINIKKAILVRISLNIIGVELTGKLLSYRNLKK